MTKIGREQVDTSASVLQELSIKSIAQRGIRIFVKRDDLIHSEVSGNKWRKLKYNLAQFKQSKKEQILTFGGAYSNHLLATASACRLHAVSCIGIVRGEELSVESNAVLKRCAQLGMKLVFVTRDEYALRGMKEYHEELVIRFPNSFIVPEGGANYYGIIGCQEVISELTEPFDHLFVAQGTTTTSCGLALGMENAELHVVPVLKGFDALAEMKNLLGKTGLDADLVGEVLDRVRVHPNAHFGGYGKTTPELEDFIQQMKEDYALPLDPVYTGKAFYALLQELKDARYNNQTVVFLHTGGCFFVSNKG